MDKVPGQGKQRLQFGTRALFFVTAEIGILLSLDSSWWRLLTVVGFLVVLAPALNLWWDEKRGRYSATQAIHVVLTHLVGGILGGVAGLFVGAIAVLIAVSWEMTVPYLWVVASAAILGVPCGLIYPNAARNVFAVVSMILPS